MSYFTAFVGLVFASVVFISANAVAQEATGTWTGTYTCAQGKAGLTVILTRGNQSGSEGYFSFYPVPENPDVPKGCFAIRVEREANGQWRTSPAQWYTKPPNYVTVDLSGRNSGGLWHGQVIGPQCRRFYLTKRYTPITVPSICGASGETLDDLFAEQRRLRLLIMNEFSRYDAIRLNEKVFTDNCDSRAIRQAATKAAFSSFNTIINRRVISTLGDFGEKLVTRSDWYQKIYATLQTSAPHPLAQIGSEFFKCRTRVNQERLSIVTRVKSFITALHQLELRMINAGIAPDARIPVR